jgi:hypothetical protein
MATRTLEHKLAEMVHEKLLTRKPSPQMQKEKVVGILKRCTIGIVGGWLARVKKNKELNHVVLTDQERTGYLPKLIEDLIIRLNRSSATTKDSDALFSTAAVAHGRLRYQQGYTPGMLVHEARILEVTVFGTLQNNLSSLDFSLLLPDVMTVADEVDAQLSQSIGSYMKSMQSGSLATAAT